MKKVTTVMDEIKDVKIIKEWVSGVGESTERLYLNALAHFYLANNIRPAKMLEIAMEEEYPTKGLPIHPGRRSIKKWFENFDHYCIEKKYKVNTWKNMRASIKAFFHNYEVWSTPKARKNIKKRLQEPNKREGLKKSDIKKLLDASASWKYKSMILVQVSSGMAESDTLNLKVKDFKNGLITVYDTRTRRDAEICILSLTRGKTKNKFTTFLSEETVKAIKKYLEMERENPSMDEPLFTAYKRIPTRIERKSWEIGLQRLNRKIGWHNKKGEYGKATSHMFRKFFNTQMINAGMPDPIRKHMMAHKVEDINTGTYYLPDLKTLQKHYLNHMNEITIGHVKPPVTMSEYVEMKGMLDDAVYKYRELKETLAEKDEKMDRMNKKLEEMEERMEWRVNLEKSFASNAHKESQNQRVEIALKMIEGKDEKIEEIIDIMAEGMSEKEYKNWIKAFNKYKLNKDKGISDKKFVQEIFERLDEMLLETVDNLSHEEYKKIRALEDKYLPKNKKTVNST